MEVSCTLDSTWNRLGGEIMKLCFGTFARVLKFYRVNSRNPSQAKLVQILFGLPLKDGEYSTTINDQAASRLLSLTDSVPPIVLDDARGAIESGKLIDDNFHKRIIKARVIKTDQKSLTSLVSTLLDIIEKDDSILGDTQIDDVGGKTKNALLSQCEFRSLKFHHC